jgi:hypothetical protein
MTTPHAQHTLVDHDTMLRRLGVRTASGPAAARPRAGALADGYRLGRDARRAVPALIAPMIRGCADSVVAKARSGQRGSRG